MCTSVLFNRIFYLESQKFYQVIIITIIMIQIGFFLFYNSTKKNELPCNFIMIKTLLLFLLATIDEQNIAIRYSIQFDRIETNERKNLFLVNLQSNQNIEFIRVFFVIFEKTNESCRKMIQHPSMMK